MKILRHLTSRHEVTPVVLSLLVIMIEVSWIYPWLLLLEEWPYLGWHRPPLSLAASIMLLVSAYATTRWLVSRTASVRWLRTAMVVGSLISIFLVIRIEYHTGLGWWNGIWYINTAQILEHSFSEAHPLVLALPVAAYLWWRGIRLGRRPLTKGDIFRSFATGIGALVVLIFVWWAGLGTRSLETLASTITPYVATLFFFGLVSLALSNLLQVRERILPEDRTRYFAGRWLLIMLLVVGSIVLAAVAAASLFSPEFVNILTSGLRSIWEAVTSGLRYLLIPLAYLAAGLVYAGRWIVSLITKDVPPDPFQAPGSGQVPPLPEPGDPLTIPGMVTVVLRWVLLAVVCGVVILLLARAVRRYRAQRGKTEVDETSESLWSWIGFKSDMLLFLRSLLGRLRRRMDRAIPTVIRSRRPKRGESEGTLSIRQLYGCLLRRAAELGVPRQQWETPYEYAERLNLALPGSTGPVIQITELYVAARYGESVADGQQVGDATRLWWWLDAQLWRSDQPAG
jgi:hypothetical protein